MLAHGLELVAAQQDHIVALLAQEEADVALPALRIVSP